jgi:hypothetical protein
MSDHRTPLSDFSEATELLPILPERKSILKSKTFWLQMVALLSTFSPQVRDFIASNPVEFAAVLGALNVIMRFATKGEVGLTVSLGGENNGGGSGWVPLLATMGGLATTGIALPALLAI